MKFFNDLIQNDFGVDWWNYCWTICHSPDTNEHGIGLDDSRWRHTIVMRKSGSLIVKYTNKFLVLVQRYYWEFDISALWLKPSLLFRYDWQSLLEIIGQKLQIRLSIFHFLNFTNLNGVRKKVGWLFALFYGSFNAELDFKQFSLVSI